MQSSDTNAASDPLDDAPQSAAVQPFTGVRIQRIALAVVTVLAFLAAAWIASALWAGLLLGVLTAFTLEPAHRALLRKLPRRALAAAVVITALAIVVAGVGAAIVAIVVNEVGSGVRAVQHLLAELGPDGPISPRVERSLAHFGITPAMLAERISHLADRIAEAGTAVASIVLGSTLQLLGGSLIAGMTAFYVLKDRRPIERRLQQVLPLHPRTTKELVEEFRKVGRGTLVGSVLAGLVQGLFAAVGFAIAGISQAALLGVLSAVASFVPVFGTLLVWVPVGAVLIFSGHVGAGVFQLLWGFLVTSSLVDYVVRPLIVGRQSRSHPLLFLIGVIGGVELLGGVGVIAGPIVMAFFASVLRIYRREVVEAIQRSTYEAGVKP